MYNKTMDTQEIEIIFNTTLMLYNTNAITIQKLYILRAVARTLIGWVYIHIFEFCPTDFF